MLHFILYPALGGLLIGLSASLLMLTIGRIMGVSGIFSGIFSPINLDWAWRIMFLTGLASSPYIYDLLFTRSILFIVPNSLSLMMIGGFAVGLGTSLAGGCTSGHGVCGIARFSPRSLIATVIFISSAMISYKFLHHLLLELP